MKKVLFLALSLLSVMNNSIYAQDIPDQVPNQDQQDQYIIRYYTMQEVIEGMLENNYEPFRHWSNQGYQQLSQDPNATEEEKYEHSDEAVEALILFFKQNPNSKLEYIAEIIQALGNIPEEDTESDSEDTQSDSSEWECNVQ